MGIEELEQEKAEAEEEEVEEVEEKDDGERDDGEGPLGGAERRQWNTACSGEQGALKLDQGGFHPPGLNEWEVLAREHSGWARRYAGIHLLLRRGRLDGVS